MERRVADMMSFGWRPMASCYAKDQFTSDQPTANCASPTWWYVLMAVSLLGGLAVHHRKGRA